MTAASATRRHSTNPAPLHVVAGRLKKDISMLPVKKFPTREESRAWARARGIPPAPPIIHGHGDWCAEFPGDRPEAYSANLSPERFGSHFSGDLDGLASITFSDRTQIHGKLEAGHKPAAGYVVGKDGMVAKAAA